MLLNAGGLHRHVTGAAVHRTIATRFKRDGRRYATLSADRFEHFPRTAGGGPSATTLRFPRVATIAASLRFVFEAFFRIELLITDREIELGAAIFARENLVIHRDPSGTTLPLET